MSNNTPQDAQQTVQKQPLLPPTSAKPLCAAVQCSEDVSSARSMVPVASKPLTPPKRQQPPQAGQVRSQTKPVPPPKPRADLKDTGKYDNIDLQ